MTSVPFCWCRGGGCEHHARLEPCPNEPVPPICFIIDPTSGTPVANSACGLCEACWKSHIAQSEEQESAGK